MTGYRAFVWTEATGILTVRSLVRISPDGSKILIGGDRNLDHFRAVVLQLVATSTSDPKEAEQSPNSWGHMLQVRM
jgi:hypothetical protein